MKHQLRSAVCTEGRRMAGARALWVATGMKHEQFWIYQQKESSEGNR